MVTKWCLFGIIPRLISAVFFDQILHAWPRYQNIAQVLFKYSQKDPWADLMGQSRGVCLMT